MKAIVRETYGSPDVLELRDIDIPEIGAPNLEAGDARKSVFGSLHILTSGLAGRKLSALNTSSRSSQDVLEPYIYATPWITLSAERPLEAHVPGTVLIH